MKNETEIDFSKNLKQVDLHGEKACANLSVLAGIKTLRT